MTTQEAINLMKLWRVSIEMNGADSDHLDAFDMSIKALEKEIPQKPVKSTDRFNDNILMFYCPTCNGYIAQGNKRVGVINKFTVSDIRCGYCGQMIDWSGWDGKTGSD